MKKSSFLWASVLLAFFTQTILAQVVSGPLASTNRAVSVFNATNGKSIASTPVRIDLVGNLTFAGDGTIIVNDMTTTQRNALSATNGMIIYNTTSGQFEAYQGGSWGQIGGGSGLGDVLFGDFSPSDFGTNGAAPNKIFLAANSIGPSQLDAPSVASELEAAMLLQNIPGVAASAAVALGGDSADSFFPSGKIGFPNLPTNAAVTGQVLKFDGTIFTPQNETTGAVPTNIINNQISASAAIDKSKIATNSLWLPADLGTGTADDNGFLGGNQVWIRSVIDGQVPRISGGALAFGALDLANGSSVANALPDGNLSTNVALLNNPNLALLDKENHFSNTNSFDIPITTAGLVSTQGLVVVGSGQGFVGFEGTTAFTNFLSTVDPTGNGWFLLPNLPGTNEIAVVSQLSSGITNYLSVINAKLEYGLDTNSVDNTAVLQAALNAATNDIGFAGGTHGATVFAPPGNYNLDALQNVPPYITIEGAGPQATRFYKNTTGPLFNIMNPGGQTFRNFSIFSDSTNTGAIGFISSTNGTAITVVRIENIEFRNMTRDIEITNATAVVITRNVSTVHGSGFKLGPSVSGITVTENSLTGPSSDNILINGRSSREIVVAFNKIMSSTYGLRATNNSAGGFEGMTVIGNLLDGNNYGLYFNGTSEVNSGIFIAGNTFNSGGLSMTNAYGNLAEGVTIIGNRVTSNNPLWVSGSTVRQLNAYGNSWPTTMTNAFLGTPAWSVLIHSNIVITGTGTYLSAPSLVISGAVTNLNLQTPTISKAAIYSTVTNAATAVTNYTATLTSEPFQLINTANTNANISFSGIAVGQSVTLLVDAITSSIPCTVSWPANVVTNGNMVLTVTNGTARFYNLTAFGGVDSTNVFVTAGDYYKR